VQMQGDILQVSASQGKVVITNASPTPPHICSNTFYLTGTIAALFSQQSSSVTTRNSTAVAVMIPIAIFSVAFLIFFFRTPIQNFLGFVGNSAEASRFKWVSLVLNFFVLVLVMAAVVSNHWSKTDSAIVGPWKSCTGSDCEDTISALSTGKGNVYAVRFFMITSVFPAFAMLSFPFLSKLGYLDDIKAAAATWYSLLYIGVSCFISMCVWAAFQYDTLAHFTSMGSWSPDWAIGLATLAWLLAFSSSVVVFVWKMKAGGSGSSGHDLAAAKNKSMNTTEPATVHQPAHPAPVYSTPQPLNTAPQYGEPQQQHYDQNQQYGHTQQPGVDV